MESGENERPEAAGRHGRHGRHGRSEGSRGSDGSEGSEGRAGYDDAYLDGLFTYCLSIMCEHDDATAALGEALALAERQHERGRRPADPALRRPWLYALARWACLRRLDAGRREPGGGWGGEGPAPPRATGEGEDAQRRRRELAALAWPEAAGTTPEQREALELAVRHQLPAAEVARVLRLSEENARALLTAAAREVERTRAALTAVETSRCPAVAPLVGEDPRLLLGPRLRRELLRHVEDCTGCRLIARHALETADWPDGGTHGSGGEDGGGARLSQGRSTRLPVIAAPRPSVHAARLAIRRARAQHRPRFDRAGFPLPPRERAACRERLRTRALTGAVVAAVVAAPVIALWAAYRGATDTGEAEANEAAAAAVDEGSGGYGAGDDGFASEAPQQAGDGGGDRGGAGGRSGERKEGSGDATEAGGADGDAGQARGGAGGSADGGAGQPGSGTLTADAASTDSGTRITLTASGGSDVSWKAASDAGWLVLSQTSGTLSPGESTVIEVAVDRSREPSGAWSARVTIEPDAAVITVEGTGGGSGGDGGGGGETDPTTPPDEGGEPSGEPTTEEPDPGGTEGPDGA